MGFQVKWLWSYTKSGCLQESPMESVIQRDINRTFPAHAFFKQSGGLGQDSLYRISKAYSVYDEEIGYVQGLSFLAAALLLHVINILINQIHSANIEETKIFGQWHFDIVIFFQVCWIFFFFYTDAWRTSIFSPCKDMFWLWAERFVQARIWSFTSQVLSARTLNAGMYNDN